MRKKNKKFEKIKLLLWALRNRNHEIRRRKGSCLHDFRYLYVCISTKEKEKKKKNKQGITINDDKKDNDASLLLFTRKTTQQ